jgi:hypothetical protein
MRPPPGFLYPTELKRIVRGSRTININGLAPKSFVARLDSLALLASGWAAANEQLLLVATLLVRSNEVF